MRAGLLFSGALACAFPAFGGVKEEKTCFFFYFAEKKTENVL